MQLLNKLIRRIIRRLFAIANGFTLLFLVWWNCLPEELFDTPYATVVEDEEGRLLSAIIAQDGQWRFPMQDSLPANFVMALLTFEDHHFHHHFGVSARAMGRALIQNVRHGKRVSGGSTITMQLMRMSNKAGSRSWFQKLKEIIMATRVEFRYTKDELLRHYCSQAPMGGNVVGLEAAAWRYYGRNPFNLSWAEYATLAVLPNSPAIIHPGRNQTLLEEKRNRLLVRLFKQGALTSDQLELALMEPLPSQPLPLPQIAPHLLTRFVKSGRKGKRIKTTLHLSLQEELQTLLNRHVAHLQRAQIHNAALVVMETETGKVLAYVGNSTDSTKNNAVDIIPAPRSSGSILKPFLFCHSLEEGIISPEMLLFDVPTYMNGYSPRNYYDHYDGLVPAREALASSLNVPFVRLLADYGQRKFLEKLKTDGFTQFVFNADHYGTSLILGGGEVSLEDLANAYGRLGKCALQTEGGTDFHVVAGEKNASPFIFETSAAYHTLDALTKVVRPDLYGNWERFEQPLRMAWKTGTSFGFRDAWAVGVTPQYTIAVWVGNANGEGRPGIIGVKAAAPLLFEVAKSLPTPNSSLPDFFEQPYAVEEVVQICSSSGMKATDICPTKRERSLPQSIQKLDICAYHKTIFLDKTKSEPHRGHLGCRTQEELEEQVWFVLPPLAEKYYRSRHPNFRPLPPFSADCETMAQQQVMEIIYPKPESKISIPRGGDEMRQQVVLEATHQMDASIIYWHLNDHYLGATTMIHQMKYAPEPGENTLLIVDGSGNRVSVTFEVEGKTIL